MLYYMVTVFNCVNFCGFLAFWCFKIMLYNILALHLHRFFMVLVFKVMRMQVSRDSCFLRKSKTRMFKVYVNGIRRLIS